MLLLLLAGTGLVGSRACAPCHEALFRSYFETPMARSSGLAGRDVREGVVKHVTSSMSYRIDSQEGRPFFRYSSLVDASLSGRQQLLAFIGSGVIGRSFLFAIDRWWFLAPVSYYAQKGAWDVSPGYEEDRRMLLSRRVTESCLFCHASGARASPGTYNRFPDPPWDEAGVSCERCHGPGEAHVKHGGSIVNPAKLGPAERDSVCAQCHLTGEESIERPGQSLAKYTPGKRLSDYADYFVAAGAAMRATSHVERFSASRCKQASGNRMWCGTCHDPHSVPKASERSAYFREKCKGCHMPDPCRRGADCTGCHMPKSAVTDAAHSVLTDHSIPRRPSVTVPPDVTELVLFGGGEPSFRALGLAYANLSIRSGDRVDQQRAIRLLEQAEPKDAAVLTSLGHWEEIHGRLQEAVVLYERALRDDPNRIVAAVNLGSIVAQRGDLDRAIQLWSDAFERDPATREAGLNLAIALRRKGDIDRARAVLLRVLRFDPAYGPAHELLKADGLTLKP